MIHEKLKSYLSKRKCTLLGVGPMSVNCVDAAIELANDHEIPILLIASRRQIDSSQFGGGYVNNWTTNEFSQYVNEKDKKGKIILARDHGGPWQNNKEIEKKLGLRSAIKSAKDSYSADLEAGFQALHIDPSIDIYGTPDIDEILYRVFELYEHCWFEAQKIGQEVIFEIGTEEQSGSTNTQEELEYTLSAIKKFCLKNKIPQPSFVVIQCGTKVMEMQNVGSFDSPVRVANEIPAEIQLPKMIEICNKYGTFMKEHNTDYLSDEALRWHPRLGIHAANVAPEFGVAESKSLVKILDDNGMNELTEHFLEMSYESQKWSKWMLPNSKATDKEKALIAGHYIFASEEFIEMKTKASKTLMSRDIDIDEYLKENVKLSICRYLSNFKLV